MALTDVSVRNAKPTVAIQKLSDGAGLQLWIMPTGSKLWRLAYRFQGKQKLLAIGSYPVIALEAARKARDKAKKLLADGIDPSQQKRIDRINKATSDANTFSAIASELLQKKRIEGKASNTIGKREWLYGFAEKDLGQRPIAEISAAEVLAVLKKVEAQGLIDTAHRLRASIGEVFRFAIATQRTTNDPTTALRGALVTLKPTHRAAITDARELGALLRAIETYQAQPTTIAGLKLMALLFPRPGELRQAAWKEFDLEAAIWTIPAARTKMRFEHRIPLPHQALAIIEALKPVTGHSVYLLPHVSNPRRPMSENTLNGALRRLGYTEDQMTAHGFRAAASTLLNESGRFSPDAIERALAHQESDEVRRAYNRGAYWKERVEMMAWWADHLDALRVGAKVLPFDKRA
jgi:integrase